ncbi:MAG: hypothetical protein WA743_01290, partial [Pseudolabrys sp.]
MPIYRETRALRYLALAAHNTIGYATRRQFEGSTMDAKTAAKTTAKTGTITVGNKNWDFPVYDGTIGPQVVDIAKLYSESGMFTYDPGFTST